MGVVPPPWWLDGVPAPEGASGGSISCAEPVLACILSCGSPRRPLTLNCCGWEVKSWLSSPIGGLRTEATDNWVKSQG